jgi:hypothetical protein
MEILISELAYGFHNLCFRKHRQIQVKTDLNKREEDGTIDSWCHYKIKWSCNKGSWAVYGFNSSSQKLALTSPTSGGRSVGIVRSRTQATELVSYINCSVGRIVTRVYVRHTMLVRIMSGMFRTGH